MHSPVPLFGKKILVPRGKKEAKAFSALVEKYGGVPVEIPLLSFRPIVPSKRVEESMDSLHTYDWIIFTSNVTVETFLSFMQSEPILIPKIAVIGKRTAEILEKNGFNVEFIPTEFVAEGFVQQFLPYVEKGMKILLPKGNLARDVISDSLTKAGALVDELIVYETFLPEESKLMLKEALSDEQIDILTFTSPSTVAHFMEVVQDYELHKKIDHCVIACIGPVTKEKIESIGLKVDVIPETFTVEDMLKEIMVYLQLAE